MASYAWLTIDDDGSLRGGAGLVFPGWRPLSPYRSETYGILAAMVSLHGRHGRCLHHLDNLGAKHTYNNSDRPEPEADSDVWDEIRHMQTRWGGAFGVTWCKGHPENEYPRLDDGSPNYSMFTSIDWGNCMVDAMCDAAYEDLPWDARTDPCHLFSHPRPWHFRSYGRLECVDPSQRSPPSPPGLGLRLASATFPALIRHAGLVALGEYVRDRLSVDPTYFKGVDLRSTVLMLGYHRRADIRRANTRRVLALESTAHSRHRLGLSTTDRCLSCSHPGLSRETISHRTRRCVDSEGCMLRSRQRLRDNFLRLLDALDGIPHPVRAEARRLLRITPSGRFRPPPRLSGALTQLLSGVSPGELREWLDASSASEGRRQTFLRRIGGLLRRFRSQVRRHAIASASSQGASHPEPPDSDHGTDSDDSAPSSSPSGSDGHSTPSLSPSDASSDSDGPRPPSASAGRAQRSPPPPAGAHCSPPPPAGPQGDPASPSRTIGADATDPHTPPSAEPQGPETPLPSSSDSDSGSDALAPGPDRPRSRPRRNPPARPTLATVEPDTMLIHPMPLLSLLSLPDRQHDATQAPLSGHQIRSFPLQAPLPDPKSSDIYGWLD